VRIQENTVLQIVEYGKSRLIEARTIHGFLDVRRIGLSTRICYLKSNWKLLSANKGLREKSKSIRYLRIIIFVQPPPLVTAAAAAEEAAAAVIAIPQRRRRSRRSFFNSVPDVLDPR
jgi:hypothetical protein